MLFFFLLLVSSDHPLPLPHTQQQITPAHFPGSRTLPALPVAMSLVASFTSSSGLLGIPLEVYTKGGNIWMWIFGFIPCFLITAYFILPIFYRLQLTNAYEVGLSSQIILLQYLPFRSVHKHDFPIYILFYL